MAGNKDRDTQILRRSAVVWLHSVTAGVDRYILGEALALEQLFPADPQLARPIPRLADLTSSFREGGKRTPVVEATSGLGCSPGVALQPPGGVPS